MKTNHGSLLVVDDDQHVLSAMADYLRGLGHRTETASNCQEAKARMREFPFEAVICDVCLPDQDGFQLLEWAVDEKPETAMILLTGYGTIDSAIEAIRAGAFDYLTKPLIDDELLMAIERALGQRKVLGEHRAAPEARPQARHGHIIGARHADDARCSTSSRASPILALPC
jgi:DNA-binding NtrC family response regulator